MKPDLSRNDLDVLLLFVLEAEPLYGFAISQAIKTHTDAVSRFKVGDLYPALHRLERDGHLEAQVGELGRNGKPRTYYRITETGRHRLETRRRTLGRASLSAADLTASSLLLRPDR